MNKAALQQAIQRNERRLAIELFLSGVLVGLTISALAVACISNAGGFL